MHEITSPLHPGDQGSEVANLQEALSLLVDRQLLQVDPQLLQIAAEEAHGQAYKDATAKLVSTFQTQRHLQGSGAVDEATATALNNVLRELGAFGDATTGGTRVVAGQVRVADGRPYAGGRVSAAHVGEPGFVRLGDGATDGDGSYSIRYELPPGLSSVDLRVDVSDDRDRPLISSDVKKDAQALEIINLTLPVTAAATTPHLLEGRIVFSSGEPAEQLKLRLYRVDFGADPTALGEAVTGEQGIYSMPFDLGDKPAGLELRALDNAGNEHPISQPIYDLGSGDRVTLNLVADDQLHPVEHEYARMAADLQPHIGQISALANAVENDQRRDLTMLNAATGWDARLLTMAASAAMMTEDDDLKALPQEVYYGLLRAGLPRDKLQLAQVSPDTVEQVLTQVSAAGIVQLDDAAIKDAKAKFTTLSANVRLTVPVPGSSATYRDLLKRSGLDESAQGTFASVYLETKPGENLWQRAREAGLSDQQMTALQLQGKLAYLAGNSVPVLERLTQKGISDPAQLVADDFDQPERWSAEVRAAAGIDAVTPIPQLSESDQKKLADVIPSTYIGDSLLDRFQAYSGDMARKLRISYPTQALSRVIVREDRANLRLGDADTRKAVANALVTAAGHGFHLGRTPAHAFFDEHPEALAGVPNPAGTKANIKMLQRVFQITPSNEMLPVLLHMNLTSAYDVAAMPEDLFLSRYADAWVEIYKRPAPPADTTRLIHRKATQVNSMTFNMVTAAAKFASEPAVQGMAAPAAVRQDFGNTLIKQFPTLETLFGSFDFCNCEHCRSVLSPAAYLVDLLQFIDPNPTVWGHMTAAWSEKHDKEDYFAAHLKPYDALIARRPDIPNIPLTCENTLTALPYIDVVNEILEYYVANNHLDAAAAQDTGAASTADLLAEPQNVIAAAYERLQRARYPLTLPFDLWIETVREFCAYFQTPLWTLLEAFRPVDTLFAPTASYDRSAIFIESLGLTPSERALFTDPDPLSGDKWFELYGYSRQQTAIVASANVENATLTIANDDAQAIEVGDPYTYIHHADGKRADETLIVREIGARDSAGDGQTTVTFTGIWSEAPVAGDHLVVAVEEALKSARTLARRLGVSYQEIADIVQAGFINPGITALVTLYKLGVNIESALAYQQYKPAYDQNKDLLDKDRTDLTPAQQQRFDQLTSDDRDHLQWVRTFEEQLAALKGQFAASGVDDPQSWLETELQQNTFAKTLVLADSDAGGDFSRTTLRFADGTPADDFTFLKINLFVRLWRKLGWTMDEVDRSLQTFIPAGAPFTRDNLDKSPLTTALISMAHLKRLGERKAGDSGIRQKLLTLWADMPTRGQNPLYAQLFLKPSVLKSGEVFDAVNGKTLSVFDDYLGEYLTPDGLKQLAGRVRFEARAADVAANLKLDHDALTDDSTKEKLSVSYDDLNQEQRLAFIGALTDQEKAQILARGQNAAQQEMLGGLLDSVQQAGLDFSLVAGHMTALQGALGLGADDIVRILADAGMSPDSADLSLTNVSLLYRYGLLAGVLQMPVRDLITLKALSGLEPFMPLYPDPLDSLEHDYPFDQTWRFVEIADLVSSSGLAIQDLDYLLRHRFDPSGPYRPDDDATRLMLTTLAAAIAKIRADNAVPAATDTVTEEALRQKLGTGLAPEVVETFMQMVNGKSTLPKEQQQEFFANHLLEQTLSVDGEVGFLKADDFETLFGPLDEANNNATRETRRHRIAEAFLPYLQRRLISALVSSTIGTQLSAEPSLVATLMSNVNLVRYPAAAGQALLESFQGIDQNGVEADFFDATDLSGERQATSATVASADTNLKDSKDGAGHNLGAASSARFSGYLVVPAQGSYRFYAALEKKGARAALRFDHLAAPVFDRAAGADNSEIGDQPDEYVELEPGIPYGFTLDLTDLDGGSARVFVRGETLPKAPLAQLALYPRSTIDRASTALLLLRKVLQLAQALGLDEREIRYFANHAADFGGLDLSKLATRDALAELETIAASLRRDDPGLSVADAMDQARQANPTLADEGSWPDLFFQQFLHLARYARLKQEMAGGADDLIGVFEAANIDQTIPENADKVYSLIAGLTRRDSRTVKGVARALSGVPAIKDDRVLRRVWDALQIVDSLGVSVADLLDWTRIVAPNATDAERFSIAHDLKEAVKARLDQAAWQRVAQPIFDKLRQRQRDALSVYIMQRNKFERPEQLYEYFLIDPGMEPVVQTSRIRLAISSVQLFIQRCLLNLEPEVPPSIIQSDQWEWMKRYRVWEANRKIFLYPENWLEPEFRDDKTHLFNELESNLLQGDVSNDLVEDAFLTYLRKLEELARLDIVAMHLEDADDPADRVLHVIGRTHSQPYKYFYRRYLGGAWTPWEPVTAEISGDHLAPVVWRDRLYLFWVTFVVKPEEPKIHSQSASPNVAFALAVTSGQVKSMVTSAVDKEPPITDMTLSQISASAASTRGGFTVEAHLNWSEYLQGEWSTRETGGSPDASPVVITGQTSFDPSAVFVYVSKDLESDGSGGVFIHLSNPFHQSFYLAGRNSVPVKSGIITAPRTPFNVGIPTATHYLSSGKLSVTFRQRITTIDGVKQPDTVTTNTILGTTGSFTLLACDNDLDFVPDANDSAAEIAGLIKPIFFQDQSVNLFLEPSVDEQTVDDWKEWVTRTTVPDGIVDAPDIGWLKDHLWRQGPVPKAPIVVDPRAPIWDPPVTGLSRVNFANNPDWLTHDRTVVNFQGEFVGAGGKLGLTVLPAVDATAAAARGEVSIVAHDDSDNGVGGLLVIPTDNQLVTEGQTSGGLSIVNVVGESGLSSSQTLRLGTQRFLTTIPRAGAAGFNVR